MSIDATTARLWFTGKTTESARLYSKLPKSRHPGKEDEVWLPLSQIEHTTKYPPEGDEWPIHVITLPEWLAKNHDL